VTSLSDRRGAGTLRWARTPGGIVGAVAVALIVTFALGARWGTHRTETGSWHTGRAYVGASVVTIDYDGWTYGASDAVPSWIDSEGTWHEGGWPDCLRPVGARLDVRFQARTVTISDTTTRPIVAVDCSGSSD
jgi:hypothetical protein